MARILVIDDDEALRQSIRRILEREGHVVEEAEDGRAGTRIVREASPDLVITDLIMPGQEGIETIIQLREEFPELKILAVSGGLSLDPEGPLKDAEALGADASLSKPFGVEEFLEVVRGLLARGG